MTPLCAFALALFAATSSAGTSAPSGTPASTTKPSAPQAPKADPAPAVHDAVSTKPGAKAQGKPAPSGKKKSGKHRGCRAFAPPSYRKMVRRWQTVPPIPKPKWRAGFRDLALYAANIGERLRVFPYTPDGTLDPEAVGAISQLVRDKDTSAVHPIAERLVKLLYKLAVKFDVRQIVVVSGYRQPEGEEGGGHHADGTAIDIAFSGVRLPVLAEATRRLGHVGVGFYPTSGFVHLDVRGGRSYFWVDRSGPGQSGCLRPLGTDIAAKHDGKWSPEKDEPVPKKNKKGELLDDGPHE